LYISLSDNPSQSCRASTALPASHSVSCQPTQVNVYRLNPRQTGQYSIYLPWWLVMLGTCKASRFDSNRPFRFDSIQKL